MLKHFLHGSHIFEELLQFLRCCSGHFITYLIYFCFNVKKILVGAFQYISYGHSFFKGSMLIQIAGSNTL